MDLHQLRLALLKLSLVVVAGTSWVFLSFVFSSRPSDEDAAAAASALDPLSSLVRLPASLPQQLGPSGAKPMEPIRMDTLALDCWDRPERKPAKVAARWVRLTGKTCQGVSASDKISVRNLTNGYVATVFDASSSVLTTDFIPVEVGHNEIQVRLQGEGVTSETDFVLER